MNIEKFERSLKSQQNNYLLITKGENKLLLEVHRGEYGITLYYVATNGFHQQTSNSCGHHYRDFETLLKRFGINMPVDPVEYDFIEISYYNNKTNKGLGKMVGIL